jgi:hypothetical protein
VIHHNSNNQGEGVAVAEVEEVEEVEDEEEVQAAVEATTITAMIQQP